MGCPKGIRGITLIIVRVPLRVSLFGGGTDIDPFMTDYGGKVLSLTIDKYIYLSAHPLVESSDILLKYSRNERVTDSSEIKHNVFRLISHDYELKGIDIAVSSDIAAGTGLGSSSAFTVGLVHLVESYQGNFPSKRYLADKACEIEIDQLGEPVGLQDQYASAFGGLNMFQFNSRKDVAVQPIYVEDSMKKILRENCLLIRVLGSRSASKLLEKQRSQMSNPQSIENLKSMKSLVEQGLIVLNESPKKFGELLNVTWNLKKQLSPDVSSLAIDASYKNFLDLGFYGGKLLGAGGAGYLLMVGPEKVVENIKLSKKYSTLEVNLESHGSQVIYNSDYE